MESETPREGRRGWRDLRVSWKVLVPTVAALGLGIGGAVAAASIPSSNGTITGCYVTPNGVGDSDSPVGSLRVIDPSDTTDSNPQFTGCTQGEATITWNQQGPAGPQGIPGQNGMNGMNGQNGQNGATGPAGGVSASPGSNTAVIMELTPMNANLGGLNSIPVGESQVSGTQNQEFNVTSFDLGASSPGLLNIGSATTGAGAGAGAGKVTFQPFTVTKTLDKYSSDLFLDLAAGKALASAEIIVRRPEGNGTATPIAQYLMKQVVITNVHVSGTANKTTETIQGEYGSIQFVFYGQKPDGSTAPVSSGGWSQVKNASQPVIGVSITSKRHRRHH
jgi:type VI protein secretion system component Hcp